MSWPTRTWTKDGWVDFNAPTRGNPKGFPDDWKKHKGGIEGDDFWAVMDNPIFGAAAEAAGLNWEEWKAEALASVGQPGDQIVRVQTGGGYMRPGREGQSHYVDPTYTTMTVDEAYEQGYTDEDITAGQAPHGTGGVGFWFASADDDDARNWGIDRTTHGAIADDLDTMYEWAAKSLKNYKNQEIPIIERGPQGSDYGIEGDIWEFYGLDHPPKKPKMMDIEYEWDAPAVAQRSQTTYAVPQGYPTLDLTPAPHDTGKTPYQVWEQEQQDIVEQQEQDANYTSYGEAEDNARYDYEGHSWMSAKEGQDNKQTRKRWTDNVMKIIGSDNVDDALKWADVAGVSAIDSRNDSNSIKDAFKKYGGKLPAKYQS